MKAKEKTTNGMHTINLPHDIFELLSNDKGKYLTWAAYLKKNYDRAQELKKIEQDAMNEINEKEKK